MERQRIDYQRPLPGLSANGEYVTIIYVGIINLGGNLHLADGNSCDRNGRADGPSGAPPARAGGGQAAHSPAAAAPPRPRPLGKGPAGRSAAAPPARERPGRTSAAVPPPARRTARKGPAGRSAAAPPRPDAQGATENAGRTGQPGAARPQTRQMTQTGSICRVTAAPDVPAVPASPSLTCANASYPGLLGNPHPSLAALIR